MRFFSKKRADPAQPSAPAKPARLWGSDAALASMGPTKTAQPFVLTAPPPGVVPAGAPMMAQDSDISSAYAYALSGAYSEGIAWLGYPYLSELAQRPEYRRISETIAKEATRKWIKLQAVGEEDKSDKLRALESAMKRFRVQDAFRAVAEQDGFFGRGQIYLDTGAGDDPDELQTPLFLNPKKIGKGGLKRIATIEPIWTYPSDYNASDPMRPDYFRPKSWFVQGKKVHGSRLLTFVGREVPDLLKPAYNFGGLSLSQMAKPYVDNWLRTRQSVSDLLHSFSVSGIKTRLDVLMAANGGDDLNRRAMGFNALRDNRGLMLLDKETEEFFNVSTPLGTLDHLQAQSQEQLASVSGIPLVKLLGITPSGLNASSDGEIRVFYDSVHAYQEHLFRQPLTHLLKIIQLSEFGEIDEDIGFDFVPLWQLDEAGQAAVRKMDADTAIEYINAGVLFPAEERSRLAAAEDSLYPSLDLNEIPEAPNLSDNGIDDPLANSVERGGEEGSEAGANSGV